VANAITQLLLPAQQQPSYNRSMMNRRHILALGAAALTLPALTAHAEATAMSRITAYAFSFKGLDGDNIRLSSYAGHPILVVNTASLCGYTPQYIGLQALWARFHDKGLTIVGVPSNDFGGQEPGGKSDIDKTAHGEYHITFPLTEKTAVKGPNAHPFYKWAAQQRPSELPKWNFHKYLIGRDGQLKASFTSAIEPTDPEVIAAIEQELAAE
jgi:glutathione peroxidase